MRSMKAALAATVGLGAASSAFAADAPQVVADIPPIHSLVAQVMAGVAEPELAMRPGASPHGYSMRPSEAAALENADVVVWVGPTLTPWLDRAIENLAQDAEVMALTEVAGTELVKIRTGATFEAHDHDHDEHGHDDHGHDEHDDHAHDEHDHDEHAHEKEDHDDHDHEEHAHDDHDHDKHEHDEHEHDEHAHEEHEEHGHDDHDHGEDAREEHAHDEEGHDNHDHEEHAHDDHDHADGVDPHAWLDPHNAKTWLTAIASVLAEADPDHAATYQSNAEAGIAAIDAAEADAKAALEPVHDASFVVFHDAYQYFENHFGLAATGAISLGDASDPGPARVAEIRDTVRDLEVVCVFSEPQFNPRLVATVTEGTDAKSAVIDPLGSHLSVGPELYPDLIRDLAAEMAGCLQE